MGFRHENKHFLNYMDYLIIKSRLSKVMKPDEHAGENGKYKIRSIYFENYNDKVLKEKIDSYNEREKFRIRYYNEDISYIKLEKKCKVNGLSSKKAVRLTKLEVEAILNNDIAWMTDSRVPLIIELYSKMCCQMLRPKTIVDYIREAYTFEPGNVRITIDTQIHSGLMKKDFFNSSVPTVPINDNQILLEVKYDNFLPEVIENIIQLGNRRKTAFSKYAACRIYG